MPSTKVDQAVLDRDFEAELNALAFQELKRLATIALRRAAYDVVRTKEYENHPEKRRAVLDRDYEADLNAIAVQELKRLATNALRRHAYDRVRSIKYNREKRVTHANRASPGVSGRNEVPEACAGPEPRREGGAGGRRRPLRPEGMR